MNRALFIVIILAIAFGGAVAGHAAGKNHLPVDGDNKPIQAFSPYSTVVKTGYKATTKWVFGASDVAVKFQCTGAGGLKFNNQAAHYPVAAATDYTVVRHNRAVQMAISSASANTCRFLVH